MSRNLRLVLRNACLEVRQVKVSGGTAAAGLLRMGFIGDLMVTPG